MSVKITCVALMIGALFAMSVPAAADQVRVTFGSFQASNGGEFTLEVLNPSGWLDLTGYADETSDITTFQTFCIEKTEFIGSSGIYDAEVNPIAVTGGGGAGPTGDPVSVGTGWLYSQFARGVLSGYDFDNVTVLGRKESARLLQLAIWMLEDEQLLASNPFITLVTAPSQFGSLAAAKVAGGGTYGVSALNLEYGNPAIQAQSQLYFVPDGGMTLMLLGMSLAGLPALRRRVRKDQLFP